MTLAVVQPAVEALPGNYNFLLLVPLVLSSFVFVWGAVELAVRMLWRATDLDDDAPAGGES